MKKLLYLKVLTVMAIMLFALYGMAVTPIVTIQSPTSTTCGSYDVPVTVSDFKNVGAISMVLNFDPAVFAYQTPIGVAINQAINPLDADINIGIPGQFKLGWNKATGITLVDNDVLFTLHFNLLPVNRTLVPLTNFTWSSIPGDCEFAGPGASVYAGIFSPLVWTIPTRPVVNTNTNLEYCKIQDAIDAANPGNTITVAGGNYYEDILINKPITLMGNNSGQSGCSNRTNSESRIYPLTNDANPNSAASNPIIYVTANNVTIDGFTIDGSSGASSTYVIEGVTVNSIEGIGAWDGVANLEIKNNIIQNLTDRGIDIYNWGNGGAMTTGNKVHHNKLFNINPLGLYSGAGAGVLVYNNAYTDITNNCMDQVRIGIQTGNYSIANASNVSPVFANNDIKSYKIGIWHNLAYGSTSTFSINNNQLQSTLSSTINSGIEIGSVQGTTSVTVTGNSVTGTFAGINLWNNPTSATVTVGVNTFTNCDYGVFANNYDGFNSNAETSSYIIDGTQIVNSKIAGVFVKDNPLNTNGAKVFAEIKNITGTGNATGILLDGADAGANIHNNTINAIASGINVVGTSVSSTFGLTIVNNAISLGSQLAGSVPTAGIFLSKITGTAAATISNNTISGSYYGYLVYNLNTTPTTTIAGGTITGVMQGVAALNIDPVTMTAYAPSTLNVSSVIMSGFAGNYSALPNSNFYAGVYVFTGGSDIAAAITAIVDKVSVTGTGKIAKDCAGLSFADFSTGTGTRQNITVTENTLTNNLNRGINVRGLNALVNVRTSTLTGNGSDPYGIGGNDGFGIIVREGAITNVDNCFITNPSSVTAPYKVSALCTDPGTAASATINAHNNSLSQNGNTTSWLANNSSGILNATCNWWGTTGPIPPMVNGTVTWKPFLNDGLNTGTPGFIPAPGTCVNCIDMTLSKTQVNVLCLGVSTGSIDLAVTGGVAPFTYSWTGPDGFVSIIQDPVDLKAGTYNITVTDGNLCTQTLQVIILTTDNIAPALTLPAPVIVNQQDAKDPYATGVATATDCSGTVTITYDDNRANLNSCNATGTIVRTWTAKDFYGNTSQGTQTITVLDNLDPVVVVPANITVNNDHGLCSAVVTYPAPTATDFGFFQGFEDANWVAGLAANNPSTDWNEYNSQIARVASGTDGINSKAGSAHAVINTATTIAANKTGAFCRVGGYNGTFGAGFVSSVDVYFDMSDPGLAANTYGWDLDQAISDNTGGFLRDFIYHVGGDNTGIYVTVDNNSSNGLPRMSPAYIQTKTHATITSSGWYTMKWETRNNEGFLAMDFTILNASGTPVWTTTINTRDAIETVGGNRYMWFNFVSANKLAIDNTSLTRKLPVTPASLSGTAFAKGETTVTVTAEDACGHSVSNSFMVKVVDTEAPKFTSCAPAQSKIVTTDCSVAMPDFTATAFATDNCGVTSVIQVPAAGTIMAYQATPYAVTITATDEASHTATCNTTFTVQQASISGTLKYSNAVKTPMNKVTLALTPGTGTCITDDYGNYSFTGLCAGTYTISVTNNIKDIGGINSTDAAAVNLWGTSGGRIEYVNFLAGDVAGNVYKDGNGPNYYINSTDALIIQKYFVYGAIAYPFDRAPWSYWKSDVPINSDPLTRLSDFAVPVSGSNVTDFDLYGMCTGDFNGSLIPTTEKSASWTLELNNSNMLNVSANQEFELPIRAGSAMQVGAVSMILQIPSGMVNVQNILVNGSTVAPDWVVNGDELRIGWYSSTPVNVAENGNLLTLKLKTTNAFTVGESMELALKFDPLNELADRNSQVIQDASLLVAKVGNGLTGIVNPVDNNGLLLSNYPNPFKNSTTVSYALPVQGKVTIQVYNSLGQLVKSLVDANQNAGNYSIRMDGNNLMPGIYIAKLRLTNPNVELTGTVKLSVLK